MTTSACATRCSKSASLAWRISCDGAVSKSMRSSCCWRPMTRSLTVVSMSRSTCNAASICSSSRSRASERPASSSPTTESSPVKAPERRRVARDVGGAAQALLHALDPDHGHRRFRGDPADLTEPVAVEHDIADHQQANVADLVEHASQCPAIRRALPPERAGSGSGGLPPPATEGFPFFMYALPTGFDRILRCAAAGRSPSRRRPGSASRTGGP
jgi:hypothetical protein